jgi:hypothetical protein
MQRPDREQMLAAYNALPGDKKTTIQQASDELGIPRKTLSSWLRGYGAPVVNTNGEALMLKRMKELERELVKEKEARLSEHIVRNEIIKLAAFDPTPPSWVVKQVVTRGKSPGVPQLMLSDWHYGEVVDPLQVNGVNKFNLKIADARAHQIIERSIHLLTKYMTPANYPGVVVNLGGDMVSGDIHEELSATNDAEIMPTVMHIVNTLIWCINQMADAFGLVLVNCVTGNHGRNTKKIRAKGRNHTSFDWLIYAILAKHFENDKRVKFNIAGGSDLHFNVFAHRYCLTHGDQFYGGDGIIGHIGPVTRGRQKKLSRDASVGVVWDTMIHGHFHQYTPGDKIIGNGSLVGAGEYSMAGNFSFELPRQALWITHPKYGITYHIPVYASTDDELKRVKGGANWTSWIEQK